MTESIEAGEEWDGHFADLSRRRPVSEDRLPLADRECRFCGRIDCTDQTSHTGPFNSVDR